MLPITMAFNQPQYQSEADIEIPKRKSKTFAKLARANCSEWTPADVSNQLHRLIDAVRMRDCAFWWELSE